MKALISILLASCLFSCELKPEPLRIGQDACYACKMKLTDQMFGAEIVTKKGKVYKFDDIGCMLSFNKSGEAPGDNVAYRLVIDFARPEKFIQAQEAFYVQSDIIKSPMGSGLAAFSNLAQLENHNKEWKGVIRNWGELVTSHP